MDGDGGTVYGCYFEYYLEVRKMKTVCKKLFSLMLVAVLLISAIPFQASAAAGDPVNVYFRVDNEPTSFLMTNKTKIGGYLGAEMPTSEAVTANYNAKYSDGKVFINKWVLAEGPKAGTAIGQFDTLSEDMKNSNGDIVLRAVFAYPDVTVTLNANGGSVDTTSKTCKVQDVYGTLPTPTRDGYIFAGWYSDINDETTLVTSGTVVTGNVTLYAKWDNGSLPVVFQKWNASTEKWEEVTRRTAYTGKSLRQTGVSLPAQDAAFDRAGYSINETNPWIDANGNVFTVDTVINAVTYVRPNYVANEYTITYDYECDELSNETQKVTFGSKVNLKQPTRANYVFRGWLVLQDNYKELKTGDTYYYGDITLLAQWAPKGTVELRVYRDDADGFKTYYYSGAILNGELNLNDCNIKNYLSGTYDFDGWYDYNGWVSYLGTKNTMGVEYASNAITRVDKITTSNTGNSTVTVIYGMVKGYKTTTGTTGTNNSNGNSTNNATRDPSNPATGDYMITVATTTMLVSAAAMVLFLAMRKRTVR